MMNATGARLRPSTQPMPITDVMLKTGKSRPSALLSMEFTTPMRGCIRKSQPIAVAKPGNSRPIVMNV